MKLHGDLISPFVRMSMVTALEAGIGQRVQLVHASAKPQEVNPDLERISAIGKVPVLETDHGHPLYDSRVIMEYFCHVAGNKSLLPDDGVKRFRILTLQALAIGMGDASVALRYEQAARPAEHQWPDLKTRQTARINACLNELESIWHDALQDVTLGSIATAVVLSYIDFRHAALNWRNNRAHLKQFHEKFSKRDSMINTALQQP
jgi:glutathione S-transferase